MRWIVGECMAVRKVTLGIYFHPPSSYIGLEYLSQLSKEMIHVADQPEVRRPCYIHNCFQLVTSKNFPWTESRVSLFTFPRLYSAFKVLCALIVHTMFEWKPLKI